MSILQQEYSGWGFCAVFLRACSLLAGSLFCWYICWALLPVGHCHCPVTDAGVEGGVVASLFTLFTKRSHSCVCPGPARRSAWVVGPSTPCQGGKENSHQMTLTRASGTALQGWQGTGIVLCFVLAAESQGFRQKMFIKNTRLNVIWVPQG